MLYHWANFPNNKLRLYKALSFIKPINELPLLLSCVTKQAYKALFHKLV